MKHYEFKRLRKRLFRTQQQAAEAMGVSNRSVSHWETGRIRVPERAVKFLQLLEKQKGVAS
jgi:DNA-binding transcriptional regulator YiaG